MDTGTTTLLMKEPVAEAVYADSPDLIILKTAKQSKTCDVFQVWNRRKDSFVPFSVDSAARRGKPCPVQRELNAFPGHQFLSFKESAESSDLSAQTLVIADPSGGRLQTICARGLGPDGHGGRGDDLGDRRGSALCAFCGRHGRTVGSSQSPVY